MMDFMDRMDNVDAGRGASLKMGPGRPATIP